RIEFCCVVEKHRWAGSNSMYHRFFGSRVVQIELAAYEPARLPAQLPNHTSPTVGDEWQPQEAQPDDAPLPAKLGRTEVITLHRHQRGFTSDDEVAVLHTADEKQRERNERWPNAESDRRHDSERIPAAVAAAVLQWVAQEVPIKFPAPVRPLWFVPRGRLLFVVVLKPPDRVELLQERLGCSSSDRLCFNNHGQLR